MKEYPLTKLTHVNTNKLENTKQLNLASLVVKEKSS